MTEIEYKPKGFPSSKLQSAVDAVHYNMEPVEDRLHDYNNQIFTTTPSENFNSALVLGLFCFKM